MAQPKIIADFETQLASAIAIGGTSFDISSALDDDGNAIPSGLYYFTIDKGNSSKEYLSGNLVGTAVTGVKTVSRQAVETSGAARKHRVGASVILTDFATYKAYIDAIALAGVPDASQSTKGIVEIATAAEIDADTATGGTGAPIGITPDQLKLSKYGALLTAATAAPTGSVIPYVGKTAPTGWLLADGSNVVRATYAALFAILVPSGTFTVTIASPGVFTKTAHGFLAGDMVHFTTTGALPTGLSTNTDYYVITAGLTADAFQVSLSPGGAAVNTSGVQSGVHTVFQTNFGKGDGSTTFTLPDMRSKMPIGRAPTAPTITLSFESAAVDTGNDWVTILDTVFPSQGQKIQLTTTGTLPTGLSLATDYWIVRLTSTTIGFATSQANANAGTLVNITGAGSGVHTMTFTARTHTIIGRKGGEETHGQSATELASHTHFVSTSGQPNQGGSSGYGPGAAQTASGANANGDGQHNNMSPFIVLNYIIKT